jgi:threonine/homoserine/homoserine lactone efflux protein
LAIDTWLAFVAASVVVLVVPGPTILTVISYSLAHGRRAQVPLVAAVALGDSTALLASLLGWGSLLAASAFWFDAVKWAGGLYLLYLGGRLLTAGVRPAPVAEAPPAPEPRWRLFARAYGITAMNPKGIVFYVVFVPQFIDVRSSLPQQVLVLALTFVALATANATFYAVSAARAGRLLASPAGQRGFNVVGGSLLCGAGIWTLVSRRLA